jgi:serine phosphatase RsbU (regulator of sigma subunit)/anti-sigma regulatory factor (Ser/Thr protein kinase)
MTVWIETSRGSSVPPRPTRRATDEDADLIARLIAVSNALGRAMTVDEVAGTLFHESVRAVGAVAGYLAVVSDDGGRLDVLASTGIRRGDLAARKSLGMAEHVPAVVAARTGEPQFIESREDLEARYPDAAAKVVGHGAMAVLPLGGDPVLGVLVLRYAEAREFDERARQFLGAVAGQASLALGRAQLWQAERRAREVSEAAHRRLDFLARAGANVGQSLDLTSTLARVMDVLVPEFADGAMVELVDERGHLKLARLAHRDTVRERLLRSMLDRYPNDADPGYVGLGVVETGDARLFAVLDDADLRGYARDEQHLDLLLRSRSATSMALPLAARGRRIGVLTVSRDPELPAYTEADLDLGEQLAMRVALAIDNAQLLAEKSTVARSLQGTLLPPHMPDVPGLDLAARYHPAAGDTDLGGDFYDVFPLSGQSWGVVIGDVAGKGVEAASLTALARYTVRGAAMREPSPSRVLEVVNRAILESRSGERFATMVFAVLEPVADGTRVRLSCGGHPLPLLLTSYGAVKPVGVAGSALGLFDDVELGEVEVLLRPGDALVLFTDGLIEARTPDGSFAPDLVDDALRLSTGLVADDIANAVDRAVFDLEQGFHRDDLALLVLRAPHPSDRPSHRLEISVERSKAGVPAARRAVTSWLQAEDADQSVIGDAALVVSELCSNAVRAARSHVFVRAWREGPSVVLEVEDDGPGFDADLIRDVPVTEPTLEVGRGLFIVGKVADEFTTRFDPGGTTVRCRLERLAR